MRNKVSITVIFNNFSFNLGMYVHVYFFVFKMSDQKMTGEIHA